MGRKQKARRSNMEHPPEGCHHYDRLGDVPWDIQKYYEQRVRIFSRYDEGVWLTDDAWFGVTPEPVANKIAQHLSEAASSDRTVLIDAFAGAGGNVIAFALSGRWTEIHAIEVDAAVLACAKHNAEVYGVADLITWHHGDCFEILPRDFTNLRDWAVIFASPPWGGSAYRSDTIFDLKTMNPYGMDQLLSHFQPVTPDIVLYLPRSADLRQLARVKQNDHKLHVVHYCVDGASKALCAYLGSLRF